MRSVVAWTETPPEKDGVKNVCYDLCFSPDGLQLVAAVGARVLVYDAADGELLHALKGHKEAVYCVAYATNGKRFASGGADKTVIIWTNRAEGILKYTHGDSVQCLAYNPVTQQLASGTAGDLGLWSPEQKAVAKHKVSSKIMCAAWTPDGLLLALGCFDGSVSVRNRAGSERARFAAGATPAWSLAWGPGDPPVLAVGLLDGRLRFFSSTGTQRSKDRDMEGDPLTMAIMNGEHLLVAGTDTTIQMFTPEGVPLTSIPTGRPSWVWRLAARPHANHLAIGCEDGSVSMVQLVFSTVHGLYGDRYAYREAMTDVIVQHLITEQKIRVKCKEYVKKVAVYRGRVAVQLPSRVVIYELAPPPEGEPADEASMSYRASAKITADWDCNLLVVASSHLVLCQEQKLQLYDFAGTKQREWAMDAVIRYIKVAGGPPSREALLVGLKDGQVVKVFVDNPFPIPLIQHNAGIRCLDVSPTRGRLAVVDEASRLVVYDVESKAAVFEAEGANSVAWNADDDAMLCYSGGGNLTICTGEFPPHSQKMAGFVVGFKGSKVFVLQSSTMQTIDIPQSASMFRYLERKDWGRAHQIACLGVTDADWRALALAALEEGEVEVARSAFVRLRDPRGAELVDRVAAGLRGGVPRGLVRAEVLAWEGRYQEAARLYVNEGRLDKVLDMFSALRQFDEAKRWSDEYARSGRGGAAAACGAGGDTTAVSDLIGRQAEWSEETANYEAAAEMYVRAGRPDRAVPLLVRHGWWDKLHALVRALDPRRDAAPLAAAAGALRRAGRYGAAREALLKLDDPAGLADLAVGAERWEDAALLAAAHPGLAARVHLPHARWLCARDRFDEARVAFRAGGRPDLARSLLEGLADAAVRMRRCEDASHAHYRLALDALQETVPPSPSKGPPPAPSPVALAAHKAHMATAEVYAAYAVVHERAARPFRTADDATLFAAARFLVARLLSKPSPPPPGVSLASTLMALAHGAMELGAHRTARFAYGRLQSLVLPPDAAADVELQALVLRGHPPADPEDAVPMCHRCGAVNPLVNPQGDACVSCGAPFFRSPLTWEALPVVEFELEEGLGEEEALSLIGEGTGDATAAALAGSRPGGGPGCADGADGGANVLRLDDGQGDSGGGGGGGAALLEEAWAAQAAVPRSPIRLDRAALRQLGPGEVLLLRTPGAPALPPRWLRAVDPEALLVVGPCGHVFEEDEYEMALLEKGCCPFSRERDDAIGSTAGGPR